MNILLAVLLFALPVFADEGTLKVPTDSEQTEVTAPYVYVTGPQDPGVLMTAKDRPVSATVDGDVDAVYGGADMETSGSGSAVLKAGGIRGRFGVLAYINGGQIMGEVDSITASGDTALEAVLSRSGSLQFTANTISSDADAVTVETGVDFTGHIFDRESFEEPEDPDDDDWDLIPEDGEFDDMGDSGESDLFGKNLPVNDSESLSVNSSKMPVDSFPSESIITKADGGSGDVMINSGIIEAGGTAVDIMLNDDRSVSLTAEDITSEGSAVLIELSDEGGDVTLTAPFIDADEHGISIMAPNGTVTVTNEYYLGGKSAAEVVNDGAEVSLDAGLVFGGSGLYVESTSGSTVGNTEDIAVENYGIYVRTHDPVEEQQFDPYNENAAEPESFGSQKGDPSVSVTVDGDITNNFELPEESGDDYSLPEDEIEARIAKDGEEETEAENAEVPTGIIVEADTSGTIEINVLGDIDMDHGSEIDADNGAEVTVSIQDDITAAVYGNSISADNAVVNFTVGKNINAGGKALDTLASNEGQLNITVNENIVVSGSGNEDETAGIYANSMENGSTTIDVKGSINVSNANNGTKAYGIRTENISGEIEVTVGDDVISKGSDAVGMEIINGSDSGFSELGDEGSQKPVTIVEINGDLTGGSTGLMVDTSGSSEAKVFVEGTISGDNAGVEISEETAEGNLDLTAWKIVLKDGKAVTGGLQSAAIENNINYLIKYATEDLERRVQVFDENGSLLEWTHGYQYAKNGTTVYFQSVDGDIAAIYNGIDRKIPLRREEDGSFSLRIPAGGGVWISSGNTSGPVYPPSHTDFYPVSDLSWLYDRELPGTGFPASHVTPLAARPQGMSYGMTGLTLQIPSLDVSEDIMMVPKSNEKYPVEWLGRSVGLLEESSLPGEGITVLTGHNHLNTMEAGPFVFLKTLEAGDVIMVTGMDGSMQRYSVYGNYRIASDTFASLSSELRGNSLVLMTCEDESIEGGYINRRVILAEPAGQF